MTLWQKRYVKSGLAWTTSRTYETGEKRFIHFFLSNRLMSPEGDIPPSSEGKVILIDFASYLARTVKHSTIKLYLAPVRNWQISCGHGDPLSGKLLLKKILRGNLRQQGQPHILCQPITKPLSKICTLGWGITTLLWSGQPPPSPFLHFSTVEKLLFRGFQDFTPRLTCLLTVCHSIPVWLPHSECLLLLSLPRPMPFTKGICLFVIACSTFPVCAVTAMCEYFPTFCQYRPLSSFQLGVYLLDPLLLTFSGMSRVKSVYHISLLKGTVFGIGAASQQLLQGCQTCYLRF